MAKNTSIVLGEHFDRFINGEVASGKYGSTSEVVRSALRLLEHEELKAKQLRKELQLGEQSPMQADFDAEAHIKELHKRHA